MLVSNPRFCLTKRKDEILFCTLFITLRFTLVPIHNKEIKNLRTLILIQLIHTMNVVRLSAFNFENIRMKCMSLPI